jgi:hypothetical protein
MLRVGPYFYILALFKSFQKKGATYSNHTRACKQFSKLKQHNINYIKLIKLLRDDYHKQAVLISESRCDSNRCTPYRENSDQHAT